MPLHVCELRSYGLELLRWAAIQTDLINKTMDCGLIASVTLVKMVLIICPKIDHCEGTYQH